jgi:excisionase family DNA binding protein
MEEAKTVDLREAAQILCVSFSTVNRMHQRGQLPGCFKLGRRVLVHSATLERFIEEQATAAGAGSHAGR